MTTYTVVTPRGELVASGLSLRDAAIEVLTSDGRDFNIREENGEFVLWSRKQLGGVSWRRTVFRSANPDPESAEMEILEAIVDFGPMPGYDKVMTDEEYAALIFPVII